MRNARRLLPWLGPLLVLLIELPELWPTPHVGEWFLFWYAGHLVATGASPYDPVNWLPAARDYGPFAHGIAVNTLDGFSIDRLRVDARWFWPPAAGILLAPFGALPLETGIPALHLATIAIAIASAVAIVRILVPSPHRPLALAIVLASPPIVQVMRASSVTLVVLPSSALLFAATTRRAATRLGVAATGLTIRPQLFAVLGLALAAVLALRRAWRSLAIAVTVWLALNVIAFLISPVPLDPSILDAARAFPLHDNVSVWRLAYVISPGAVAPVAFGLITIAAVCGVVAIRNARNGSDEIVLAVALAFSNAVVPYAHAYDQLALVPAWLISLRFAAAATRGRTIMLTAIVIVALVYGWTAYLVGAAATRAPGGLSPILTLAILALAARAASPRRP